MLIDELKLIRDSLNNAISLCEKKLVLKKLESKYDEEDEILSYFPYYIEIEGKKYVRKDMGSPSIRGTGLGFVIGYLNEDFKK